MASKSAGLLLFRESAGGVEVLLAHPGGPYWAKKDEGAWSIPKGELAEDEDPLEGARREFVEETGFAVAGEMIPLEPVRQPSGKVVHAWAVRGDLDAGGFRSSTFLLEWPPRSGRMREFPEIDRLEWFPIGRARRKILRGQRGLLEQLDRVLGERSQGGEENPEGSV